MTAYRVISTDLRTGTRIAEIPLTGLQFSARLNSIGTASGSLFLPPPTNEENRVLASIYNDAVDECRRQIVIEREGVPVWCGIVWLSPYNDEKQTRDVRASEDWSYFKRRVIDTRQEFTSTDQLTIARTLINNAQASPGGNINITVGSETSGVTISQTFERYELKPVSEAIEGIAATANGFDFAIEPSWNPTTGALIKNLRLSYPRRGRRFNETGWVFEIGRNVTAFDWPSDGTKVSNKVWATGNGEGDAMLITSAADASQILAVSEGGPGYPLLESTLAIKDETSLSILTGRAQATLAATENPIVLPTIKVRADMDPVFGSFIVGDACRIVIPANVSPRFPAGLDTYRRIVGYDMAVSDEGDESLSLILGDEN